MINRSRGSFAAAGAWAVAWVLALPWLAARGQFGWGLGIVGTAVAILGFVVLWNLDDLRRAWREDRAGRSG